MKSSNPCRITRLSSLMLLCVLLSFSLLIACTPNAKEKDTSPAVVDETPASVDYNKIMLDPGDYDEVNLADFEVSTKDGLGVTLVKDGVIYGTGSFAGGGGGQSYLQFSLDFSGNVREKTADDKSVWHHPLNKTDQKNLKHYFWEDRSRNSFVVDYSDFSEINLGPFNDPRNEEREILATVIADDYYYFKPLDEENYELYKMNFKTKEHERHKLNDDFSKILPCGLKYIGSNIYFLDRENINPDGSLSLYEYNIISDELTKIMDIEQSETNSYNITSSGNFIIIRVFDEIVLWSSETKSIEKIIKYTYVNNPMFLTKENSQNELYLLSTPGKEHITISDVINEKLYELKLNGVENDFSSIHPIHIDEKYLYVQSFSYNLMSVEDACDKFFRIELDKIFNNKNLVADLDVFYDGIRLGEIPVTAIDFKAKDIGKNFGIIDYADKEVVVAHTAFGIFIYDTVSPLLRSFTAENFGLDSFNVKGEHPLSVRVIKDKEDKYDINLFIRNPENKTAYEYKFLLGLVKRSYANEIAKHPLDEGNSNYSSIETNNLPGIEKYADLKKDDVAVKIDDYNYVFFASEDDNILQLAFYNIKNDKITFWPNYAYIDKFTKPQKTK